MFNGIISFLSKTVGLVLILGMFFITMILSSILEIVRKADAVYKETFNIKNNP